MRPFFHRTVVAAAVMAVAMVLSSCGNNSKSKETAFQPVPFPLPSVPGIMDEADRKEYVLNNFWKALTDPSRSLPCKDTTLVKGVERAEIQQAMSNYIMLLSNVPLETAEKAMAGFAGSLVDNERADTSSNVLEVVGNCLEFYLFDPNSPFRDEDIYRPYAELMSRTDFIDPSRREAYAEDAAGCALNRRGTKAADFSFTERSGRTGSLYGTKAEYTILFFSNPGCTACKSIIETLSTDEKVISMIASGRLQVLNIYIDEDLGEWYKYMPIYPDTWHNGYDHNHIIRDDNLYNVRAIPSLYFLDADKKVLLKDTTTERLMNYIYEAVS